jgi:hypothetical protein
MTTKTITREAWLQHAIAALRPLFADANITLPDEIAVSCGFPGGGSPRKRIGECWATRASEQAIPHLFISPVLDKREDVLGTLVHELVHASDDCASGHKGDFAKRAKAVGLTGKMTATVAGDDLAKRLDDIAKRIEAKHGEYPHKAIRLGGKVRTSPKSWHKAYCPESGCEYHVRVSRKPWEEIGAPACAEHTTTLLVCDTLDEPANLYTFDDGQE